VVISFRIPSAGAANRGLYVDPIYFRIFELFDAARREHELAPQSGPDSRPERINRITEHLDKTTRAGKSAPYARTLVAMATPTLPTSISGP